MRCMCSLSTRTARHCRPSSMCGRLAAAPAHQWPSMESTCWLPSALSAPMALRTGCCFPMLDMPGPGALLRTAVHAWLPDIALSEPPDKAPPHTARKMCLTRLKLNLFPLLPGFQGAQKYLPPQLCDSPSHTLIHFCMQLVRSTITSSQALMRKR